MDPDRYAIQKSIGVQVMHNLFVTALEAVRSQGKSVTDPEAYADLRGPPLEELEGETRNGAIVHGAEFWMAGPRVLLASTAATPGGGSFRRG